MTDEQQPGRRQEFLDLLRGGEPAPASSPPEPPAQPEQPPAAAEAAQPPAVAPEQPQESAPAAEEQPLSFEQQPPPAEEVPAALTALASDPPAPPAAAASSQPPDQAADLMDLGHDAQAQGMALGLHSIAQRLSVVAEGLRLIPILAAVTQDLEKLNYSQAAQAVDALVEWARGEEQALLTSLEQRGSARRGETPA